MCIFGNVRPWMQKFVAFSINHNVNSSTNDQGAIFGIMRVGEPLN